MEFSKSQRQALVVDFIDALTHSDAQGEEYFKRLGATVQAVMREAVRFSVLYKPLDSKVTIDTDPETSQEREMITISIKIYQPGTNDKIILERKFTKSLVDNL